MTGNIKNIFVLCMACIFLQGCAYVNDTRIYKIKPDLDQGTAIEIVKITEDLLISKDLPLLSKYQDIYPENIYAAVFEIPRAAEEYRRHPYIIITMEDEQYLELKHSEWWRKERPEDFIGKIKTELIESVLEKTDVKINLMLAEENLY